MNVTVGSSNVSITMVYRDSFSSAVTKNVIIVALGITINYINGTLIHTFNQHQILNVNPRYILFIHLVINDMLQLITAISLFVLSYVFYTINTSGCCVLLMIAIFTTLNTPLNLAWMAVECYVAVCLPLHHAQLCTVTRTYILIGSIWAVSALSIFPDLFVLLATEPLHFFYARVVCARDFVFRSPVLIEKRNVLHIVLLVVVWLVLLYSYFRILFAAKSASADCKKARNTILLHGFQLLLSMLTFLFPVLSRSLLYLYYISPAMYVNSIFVCYIVIQILPRLISPILYGVRDRTFRNYLKRYILCKKTNP